MSTNTSTKTTKRERKSRGVGLAVAATAGALVLGVTGGAVASGQIGPNQIRDNAIQNRHIGANAVRTRNVAPNSITGTEIQNNSVRGVQIQDGSIGQSDLTQRLQRAIVAAENAASRTALGDVDGRLGDLEQSAATGVTTMFVYPRDLGGNLAPGETRVLVAHAPAGKVVIGGGVDGGNTQGRSHLTVHESAPDQGNYDRIDSQSGAATAWRATVTNNDTVARGFAVSLVLMDAS